VWLAGAGVLLLSLFFLLMGALVPTELPKYAKSFREITGMALMLTLLPPYLIGAFAVGQERSQEPAAGDLA
jgi:hypothetical protein